MVKKGQNMLKNYIKKVKKIIAFQQKRPYKSDKKEPQKTLKNQKF